MGIWTGGSVDHGHDDCGSDCESGMIENGNAIENENAAGSGSETGEKQALGETWSVSLLQ